MNLLKPHLILIPGLMCDGAVWEHQRTNLHDVATITIAHHGSLDSLDAMAALILQNAPERFALAGHSMGGRVALEVVRRSPERITRLALLDTAYRPRPAGTKGDEEAAERHRLLEKARKEGMRAMGVEWVQPMVHPDRLSDTKLINAILDMIERKTPEIFAAQIKALLERPDATSLLRNLECPALVLCGRQDAWSVHGVHEEMASLIPHSHLKVIEDCGHMSTMERPAEVTAALRDWLTSL
jgi:pimeloyl-ACP methyl ester carboxylesterase